MVGISKLTVEIVEVLRRSEQGMTEPFVCRGNDDAVYFVKGTGAGRKSQICEWIAGKLGIALGLPVAPFKIVDVSEALVETFSYLDLGELGIGPAFGSLRQEGLELTVSLIQEVPANIQRDLLTFDWWIRNEDRCLTKYGGNPNLLWKSDSAELVVIDHNLNDSEKQKKH